MQDGQNDMPTLTQPNEWVSVEDAVPDPGERVLATDGIFVGEAYRSSANSWFRHTGFPWRDGVTGRAVRFWMPMPSSPDRRPPEAKDNNVPTNDPLTIEQLREMDGEPVWVVYDQDAAKTTPGFDPLTLWALVEVTKTSVFLTNNFGGRTVYADDQDLEWAGITVYRRPPEGEA